MRTGWLLGLLPLLWGCGLFGTPPFKCRAGTHPCGDGCIPTMAVCCDDGSGKTSSYCTNGAAGCFANDASRGCQAVFPSGTTAKFCCGETGTFGSNDCPDGQRHCGTLCQPANVPCCPAGATSADCPESSFNPAICTTQPGRVGCGICDAKDVCVSCPPGWCCQGGLVCGGAGARCISGPVCTGEIGGTGTPPGAGGSELCARYTSRCYDRNGGLEVTGLSRPAECGCPPPSTLYHSEVRNQDCGLPGEGRDCIFCTCP